MPTNKPRVQSILETDTYNKLQIICKNEERSESNKIKHIITEYIRNYEAQHGEIILKAPEELER